MELGGHFAYIIPNNWNPVIISKQILESIRRTFVGVSNVEKGKLSLTTSH